MKTISERLHGLTTLQRARYAVLLVIVLAIIYAAAMFATRNYFSGLGAVNPGSGDLQKYQIPW